MNELQDCQITECENGVNVTTDCDNGNEVSDPCCSAENPVKISFQDITSASYLIKTGIEYTSCTVV